MKLYHTLGGQYLIHGKEFPKGTIVLCLDNGVELYCDKSNFHNTQSKFLIKIYTPDEKTWYRCKIKMNIPTSCTIITRKIKIKLSQRKYRKNITIPKKTPTEQNVLLSQRVLDGLWNTHFKEAVFLRGDKSMEAYKMRVEFNRLFDKLKTEGITQKVFKEKIGIGSSTLANLSKNGNVTTDTICKICDYFQCMPEDIMEWIPDADYEDKRKAKEEIQAEMERLQAQLKNL